MPAPLRPPRAICFGHRQQGAFGNAETDRCLAPAAGRVATGDRPLASSDPHSGRRWYWAFKTQEETKNYSGDGLGGVIGLVVWIVAGFVSIFVIPSEVGKLYSREGQQPPVSGWAGLWFLLPIVGGIVWFVKVQGALNRFWVGKGAPA